jgi:hypothetical protein
MPSKSAGRGDLPFERIGEDSPSVEGYFFSDIPQKPCPKGVSAGGVMSRRRFRPGSCPRRRTGRVFDLLYSGQLADADVEDLLGVLSGPLVAVLFQADEDIGYLNWAVVALEFL